MDKTPEKIKYKINIMNNSPQEFISLFDSLKLYAKKYTYFSTTSDVVYEITFNNGIRYSIGSYFVLVLEYYHLLKRSKDSYGKNKIYIASELDLFGNLQEFLYICNNNISVKQYSRIKKLEKIRNDIKH